MNMEYIEEALRTERTQLMDELNACFPNSCGRRQATRYIAGLLSGAERKNGWQLAETLGDKTPYSIQQFLYRGSWNADQLRDRLRAYVKSNLGSEEAVLVVDETGFLKKGKKSAGVMRQYSGTAGRIENCQVGVFLTYAAPKGFTMIDRSLYLPKEWIDDPARCTAAGIPDETRFKTKPTMVLDMLKTANEADMPFSWVTADSVYGDYRDISMWLERISKGYVLAVSGKAYVWQGLKQHRISALLDTLPQAGWERFSAGKGSKGERYYDWLCCDLNAPPVEGWKRRLLIRRSISSPKEVRAFICFSPKDTSVQKLAQIAGTRWTVEQSFAESKGEVGLDHYEVRSYSGWYKHITLACCAHALLTVLKSKVEEDHAFQRAVEPEQSQSLRAFKRGRGL